MSHNMIGAIAIAALIAAGTAFAADAPPAAPPAPAAAPAPMAATPAAPAMPAAAPPAATPAAAPAAAPEPAAPAPMAAMPAKMEKPRVSACTRAIQLAEHDLKMSKGKPEAISGAWQHIQAAKQARAMHKGADCKSEAAAASKMAKMM